MKTVQLPGTDLRISRLGFGCAGLMGRLDAKASARLVDAALDAGISHFDTARMYGYGEAERILAPVIAARRDSVTVTTKIGILPPRRSSVGSLVRTVARRAVRMQPRLRSLVRRGAEATVSHGVFDVPTVRASFATSLRELGTDRVDVLLLHECGPEDLARPELEDFLEELVLEGRVGEYGIATTTDRTFACLPVLPPGARVVQAPADDGDVAAIAARTGATIAHSALGGRFRAVCATLDAEPSERRAWGTALGFDPGDHRRLGRAFLSLALRSVPDGCVLFSSTDPETIAANADLGNDEDHATGAVLAGLIDATARSGMRNAAA